MKITWDYGADMMENGMLAVLISGLPMLPAPLLTIDLMLYDPKGQQIENSVSSTHLYDTLAAFGCTNEGIKKTTIWDVPEWPMGVYPEVLRCAEAVSLAMPEAEGFLKRISPGNPKARSKLAKAAPRELQEDS